eukprot:scaffold25467_cov92-Amphora_coffeaeformis.AAC.1
METRKKLEPKCRPYLLLSVFSEPHFPTITSKMMMKATLRGRYQDDEEKASLLDVTESSDTDDELIIASSGPLPRKFPRTKAWAWLQGWLLLLLVGSITLGRKAKGRDYPLPEMRTRRPDAMNNKNNYCTWGVEPHNQTTCQELIRTTVCRPSGIHHTDSRIQRLLFLGDSTMGLTYQFSGYSTAYSIDRQRVLEESGLFECRRFYYRDFGGDRCHINEQLGLEYPANWTAPRNELFEGPAMYGLDPEHKHCQDKRGGLCEVLDCHPKSGLDLDNAVSVLNETERESLIYAGYIGVEFARDVELQTPQFSTTQENVASFLNRTWNTKEMLKIYEKPTCVVNTGHHDAIIGNLTGFPDAQE